MLIEMNAEFIYVTSVTRISSLYYSQVTHVVSLHR